MTGAIERLGEAWRDGRDADPEEIRRFNAMPERERRGALAGYLVWAFLSDTAVDAGRGPWEARQLLDWLEDAGAWLTPVIGVFEVGGHRYEITEPDRVVEWLRDNLPEAVWSMEESGREPLKRYRLTMSDGDAALFRTRWA